MRLKTIAFFSAAFSAVALAGCSQMGAVFETAGAGLDSLSDRKFNDDPYVVDVVGPVEVDIETFNGDVFIETNPSLEHAVVTATRRATHGYGRKDEADASLELINYSIEVVGGQLGQVLQIRTDTTHPEPHFQEVDLVIELPEVYGLKVHMLPGGHGDIVAINVQGPIDVLTYDGEVRVMTDHPMRYPVTIINNSGSIDYRVRGESAGEIDAESVRGIVTHNSHFGAMIIHEGTTHNRLLATFNGGNNPVVLRTADGDIRVAVVEEPTHVGMFIFE